MQDKINQLNYWQTSQSTKILQNNDTNIELILPSVLVNLILNFEFADANGIPVTSGIAGTLTVKGAYGIGRKQDIGTVDLSTDNSLEIQGLYTKLYLSLSGLTGCDKVGVTATQAVNVNFKQGGAIDFDVVSPLEKSLDGKTLSILDSTTSQKGAVQLTSDGSDKTSENLAVTPKGIEAHINSALATDLPNIFKNILGNAIDLNTITVTGLYFQVSSAQAAAGSNYPAPYAGMLQVETDSTNSFIYQTYTTYSGVGDKIYYRAYYSPTGGWVPWKEVIASIDNTDNLPNIFVNQIAGGINLNSITQAGWYYQHLNAQAASGSNYPVPYAGMLQVFNDKLNPVIYQFYTTYNDPAAPNKTYTRTFFNAVWSSWHELINSDAIQNNISDVTSTDKVVTPKYVKDLINQSQLNPNVLTQVYGASTSNIALTGSVTYKGLVIPNGVRWLAAGETDAKTNGIYLTNDSGAWTRTTDADTAAELYLAQVTALNGDAGQYLCTISNTAVIGTDNITFIQLYAANNEFVGVFLYNAATVYNSNTLVVNPSVSQYIWRCLIDGTNNITPSMASPNWEIYQGLLYQNSAIVAPNGNDTKSDGFPYATWGAAIADLTTGAYIEGRAVTTVEAITPKANMLLVGNNAQVSKVTLSANNVTIDSLNLLGTAANPVPISVVGANASKVGNLIATANGANNSIEFTGAWDGIHKYSFLQLTGNISIAGTTTSGIVIFTNILSAVTLTVNCANAVVYVQNCPNMTLVQTSGTIISDTNPNVIYVATTGLDTNNGLSYYTAKKTLAAAATVAGNSGKQIVVYPGTYPETSTLTNQNLSITSLNQEEGGIVNFSGAITLNPAASSMRISGVTFATLNKQGAGALYLESCRVNTAFNDSGSGFIQLEDTDTQGASLTGTVNITGSGNKNFYTDCTTGFLTINNAAAVVTLSRNLTVAPIVLTLGSLGIGGGNAIYAATATSNAITANGGTLQIDGATILTPTNTSGRISIAAGVNYVLKNVAYDRANSTISTSAVPLSSDLVINAQTDRFGTATATGTIPTNQEFTLVNSASATTQTLPNVSTSAGRLFKISNIGAGLCTVAGITPNIIIQTGQTGLFESNGTTWYQVNTINQMRSIATQTANFNAVAFTNIPVNTTSAAITATLPATPADGTVIMFNDANSTFQTNALTIARNGATINGSAVDWIAKVSGGIYNLTYNSTANNWLLVEETKRYAYVMVTANYTVTSFDDVVTMNSATIQNVTLPAVVPGRQIIVRNACPTGIATNVIGNVESTSSTTYILPRNGDAVTLVGNATADQWRIMSSAIVFARVNNRVSNNTAAVNLTPSTNLADASNIAAIGLSVTLPYIGTYRLTYNITSFQRSDGTESVQKGGFFQMYNNTTAAAVPGSQSYGSSTDNENNPGIGYSDVGCASASVIYTTTSANNVIIIRGAMDSTTGIQNWSINSASGNSTLTFELLYF